MKRPQLAEFIKRMDKNSVAVIAAAPEAIRSNDTHYRYRADSDVLYLTGFAEPETVLVIAPKKDKPFTMFVRPKDKEREIWDGFRYGVEGAVSEFGADEAFPIAELAAKLGDYLNGAQTLYYRLGHHDATLDIIIYNEIRRLRAGGRKNSRPRRTSLTRPLLSTKCGFSRRRKKWNICSAPPTSLLPGILKPCKPCGPA